MKIVINECYGGFGFSNEAVEILGEEYKDKWDIKRDDPKVIALIEEMGSEFVSDKFACLVVVEVPEEATDYMIREYDGYESVIYVVDGKIKIL